MTKYNNSLQIKIVSLLMIALPLAVICYFIIYENMSQRKAAEIDKNIMLTKSTALFIDLEMVERLDNLVKEASTPEFKSLQLDEIEKHNISLFHVREGEEFFVADTKGNVIMSNNFTEEKKYPNIQKHPSFQQALQGRAFITGESKSVLTGKYGIDLIVPVFNDSHKVIAVIGDHLDNTFFKSYVDPIKIGKTGRLSLMDDKGYFIYDKNVDTSAKLNPSRCYLDGLGQDLSVTERASQRSEQMTIFTKVKLKNLGWYLVAFQPSSDITAPGMVAVTKNLITIGLLLITLLVLWRHKISLEQRNQLVRSQNAEKLALVGELAAGMAHEIRNPLTAIKGFCDLLKTREKYREDNEILEILGSSVDHIEGIVRETLLLAKPQKMKLGDVNLAALLNDTCNFMKNEALLRDIRLISPNDPREPLLTKGDQLHLKQVLINIIKNSLEATAKGGYVNVQLEKGLGQTAKIIVDDNGEGMREKDIEKVGTPFYTTKPNGTGLGLSVCQRIVEQHGGSMNISSKQGRGTTVEIVLPLVENR